MKRILIVLWAFLLSPSQITFLFGSPIQAQEEIPENERKFVNGELNSDHQEGPKIRLAANETGLSVTHQEESSSVFEARLFDIYINYHSQPTPTEKWSGVIGEGEVYQIRPGDTLWDISRTLFGDGHFWPKVWSQNRSIKNPHLIKEGHQIAFLAGDESHAPTYSVVTKKVSKESVPPIQPNESQPTGNNLTEVNETPTESPEGTEGGEEEVATAEEIEIPTPSTPVAPVLQKIPPSLPEWQPQNELFGPLGIDIIPPPVVETLNYMNVEYYVAEKRPTGLGKVIGMEGRTGGTTGMAGVGQYIYVEIESGKARVGTILTAIKNLGRLKKVYKDIKGSVFAYNIEVQGSLELVKPLINKNGNKDLFKAVVKSSINTVTKGAILVDEKIEKIKLDINGPRSGVVSEIIGGRYDESRIVFGKGSIIFLNKGSEDGLRKNHVLSIRETISARNPDSKIKGSSRSIGWVQIAKTQPRFSTAIVLESDEAMTPGDTTSGGKLISSTDGEDLGGFEGDDIDEEGIEDDMDDDFDEEEGDEGGEYDDFDEEDL